MGTRRKQPVMVYVPPDDPLLKYLGQFTDRSGAAYDLMTLGLRMKQGLLPGANPQPSVTITERDKVITTVQTSQQGTSHPVIITNEPKATITERKSAPADPGWDDP